MQVCAVCLDTLVGEAVDRTRCGHNFHSKCLRNWHRVQPTCPMCRHVCMSKFSVRVGRYGLGFGQLGKYSLIGVMLPSLGFALGCKSLNHLLFTLIGPQDELTMILVTEA